MASEAPGSQLRGGVDGGDMSIDGDHLQRRVPEQLLDSEEIDTLPETVRSEGVPKLVGEYLDARPVLQVEADAVDDSLRDRVVRAPQAEKQAVTQGVLRALCCYVPPKTVSEVPLGCD